MIITDNSTECALRRQQLVAYLEKDLGRDRFDMSLWLREHGEGLMLWEFASRIRHGQRPTLGCGTTACAAGAALLSGICTIPDASGFGDYDDNVIADHIADQLGVDKSLFYTDDWTEPMAEDWEHSNEFAVVIGALKGEY